MDSLSSRRMSTKPGQVAPIAIPGNASPKLQREKTMKAEQVRERVSKGNRPRRPMSIVEKKLDEETRRQLRSSRHSSPKRSMLKRRMRPHPTEPPKPVWETVFEAATSAMAALIRLARWILSYTVYLNIKYDDIVMAVSVYILFDDTFMLIVSKRHDGILRGVLTLACSVLMLDCVLSTIGRTYSIQYRRDGRCGTLQVRGYFLSYNFWVDVLSVTSVLVELTGVTEKRTQRLSTVSSLQRTIKMMVMLLNETRIFRVVRVWQLLQRQNIIMRIAESAALQTRRQLSFEGSFESLPEDLAEEGEKEKILQDTGEMPLEIELYEMTMQRLVITIFCTLIALAFLQHTDSFDPALDLGTQVLYKAIQSGNSTVHDTILTEFLEYFSMASSKSRSPVLRLQLNATSARVDNQDIIGHRREAELYRLRLGTPTGGAYVSAVFDNEYNFRRTVILEHLCQPFFLVMLLVLGGTAFSRDAKILVVGPMNAIVKMVKKLSVNPLGEVELDEQSTTKSAEFETRIVANSIKKITSLLRVGFGIAGADIIAQNLDLSKPTVALDPLVPGKRVMAIIGFCDIHDFAFIVQSLESEVMDFVNTVAVIVHGNTSKWQGACNKNLGNSFLIIWRIGDMSRLMEMSKSLWGATPGTHTAGTTSQMLAKFDVRRIPGVDVLADQALIGFLKVLVSLRRDKKLAKMCEDPRVMREGKPFDFHMNFGLHAGWAIEGAVGSPYKVDATYLSPHVNMAARMETASRQYDVPILMTENFYEILSTEAQHHCRKIDVVTVKGSADPKGIYTYDAYLDQDFAGRSSFKTYTPEIWKKDHDLVKLRDHAGPEFRSSFNFGLSGYINGLWSQARQYLIQCDAMLTLIGGDGPSRTLLAFMEARNFECPPDWKGFRPLTSK